MRTVCPWEKLAYIPRRWGVRGLSGFDKQTRKGSDQQLCLPYKPDISSVPAAVEILKITMVLGSLKRIGKEVLHFLDLLQSVVDLEALYI